MPDPISPPARNLAAHLTAHVAQLLTLERIGALDPDSPFVRHLTEMLALQIELYGAAVRAEVLRSMGRESAG